jgi:uncharacterized protein (TIGR03118 family)
MRKLFARTRRLSQHRDRRVRPGLETLERREVLSTAILQTNLVSDVAGLAQVTDRNLVNPWGLAASATGPLWVSANNAGVSTIYNAQGVPQTPLSPVTIPQTPGTPAGTLASPDGIVFNGGGDFNVTETVGGVKKTGSSVFIFATEDGTIAGWAPGVDFKNAVLAVNNFGGGAGAVYKGLAIATDDTRHLLYAANFRAGTVDVFDNTFTPTTVGGDFADPSIPKGFAPFNVQEIGGHLFVTYAKQDPVTNNHDDLGGAGNGFVDEFTTDGKLERQIAAGGALDSPWGVAIAPSGFGDFSHALLVGNFRDGHINAYDISGATVKSLGQLADGLGNPITIGGLWALRFGTGGANGDPHTLYFTAGINDENDGLLGTLQIGSPIQFETKGGDDNAFLQTNLTSDLAGIAAHQDTHLINPWGLVQGPTPFWVSDNGTGLSTLYNGQGTPQALVVNIPSIVAGKPGKPTGVVFNGGGGFNVTEMVGGVKKTGSSVFIFATQQGTIAGWAPSVDRTNAITAVDNSKAGANYTGLALVTDQGPAELFAANSKGGIDVFDSTFTPVKLKAGAFTDANLPAGFTPYNVVEVNGQLFVDYSKGPASQPGDGFIDVFQTDGTFMRRFTSGGPLEEPWGMVVAPATFGKFGGDLLVGNVGNGHIDAYDLKSGRWEGMLLDGRGNPIAINGLWGLEFGNGSAGTDPNTLYFTAGIGGYRHGLYGSLRAIEPIAINGQTRVIPQGVARDVVRETRDVAVDLALTILFSEIRGQTPANLVKDIMADLAAMQKQVAPFSTALAGFVTQTQSDVQTLLNDLNAPLALATDIRHVAADLETLDGVLRDLSHDAH